MIISKPEQQLFANPLSSVRPVSGKTLGWKPIYVNTFAKSPNTNVRYFSGLEAEIFFGDVYIDEAVQIDFSIQQNTMPLFGYNSYIWDDVAMGSRLIQGRFVINFTKANFLYYVLNTLKNASINSGAASITTENDNSIEQYDDMNQKTRLANTIQDPILLHQKSPLWNCGFDIWVSYGNAKQANPGPDSTILVLKNVVINGCSQQIGISGDPIFEEYSFIARDIEFVPQGGSVAKQAQVPIATNDSDNIRILSVSYKTSTDSLQNNKKFGYIDLEYNAAYNVADVAFSFPAINKNVWDRTSWTGNVQGKNLNGALVYNLRHIVDEDTRLGIEKYLASSKVKNQFPLSVMFYYYPAGQTRESLYHVDATANVQS